ncbi:MAG: precorrin-6y C5,15-methyltransferase (decarboxylating) subunit CbiE [Chloroflexota bacterium]
MKQPIWVVGLGMGDRLALSPEANAVIQGAGLLMGGQRLLAAIESHPAERISIGNNLDQVIARLHARSDDEKIVILASGDPGFHGIAGTLLEHFPPGEVRILPHISSLQAAFARAGLHWNDAVFTSAHAHSPAEVLGWARRAPKLGILTDHANTPAVIAENLLRGGVEDCRVIVAENLGAGDERLVDARLSDLTRQEFAPLNVMLLVHDAGWRPWPVFAPRDDDAYAHRQGLITKADIRALCLGRLALRETDVVWDIGAGSGAVSIEMAEIAWRGRVFAIEKDPENLGYLRQNIERLGTLNVEVVPGEAPATLVGLPAPHAVFIGGSGGQLDAILAQVARSALPGCRVTAPFALLENMLQAQQWMKQAGWNPSLTQAQIAYGSSLAEGTRLSPLNPVFILSGVIP